MSFKNPHRKKASFRFSKEKKRKMHMLSSADEIKVFSCMSARERTGGGAKAKWMSIESSWMRRRSFSGEKHWRYDKENSSPASEIHARNIPKLLVSNLQGLVDFLPS